MSGFEDLIAFNIGRMLASGSTATERERDRLQREQHHRELLRALASTRIRTGRMPKDESHLPRDVIACTFCGGHVLLTPESTGTTKPCPHCHKDLFLWKIGMQPKQEEKIVITPPPSRSKRTSPKRKTRKKAPVVINLPPKKAKKPKELKVSCPFCQGHVEYVIAEFGGKTIACPHCENQIVLPTQ